MPKTAKHILARHQESLHGTLTQKRLQSDALGIVKPYYVYEPPNESAVSPSSMLYLFRGHEREWVNIEEDHSRKKTTAIEDIDRLIAYGLIPPMVVVLPGLNSTNNWVPSLGIDMAGSWNHKMKGLGTGRFWTYLTGELMPAIERDFPETAGGLKLMAGFSLGGFTVSLLAAKLPGYFDHAAIYDGTLMWPDHRDPRIGRRQFNDRVWCKSPLFHAALGHPRDRKAMMVWNPASMLLQADGARLHGLRKTKFWVASAARDGGFGNRDRASMFVELCQTLDIQTGFQNIIFDPTAGHTWHWADRFLATFLLRVFGKTSKDVRFIES